MPLARRAWSAVKSVILTGEAGRVLPLRLSAAEGAVLNHELESLGIEPATAARIRRALLPEELGYNQRVVDTVARGSHWQQLNCAIQDGVRCRITYRSLGDGHARERTIDPLCIMTNGDSTSVNRADEDTAIVTVRYTSEAWLFAQVMAKGGAIRIMDDPALSKRLCDYAETLVCPL